MLDVGITSYLFMGGGGIGGMKDLIETEQIKQAYMPSLLPCIFSLLQGQIGTCDRKVWTINQGFQLKLFKVGTDDLAVKDITVQAGREVCTDILFWEFFCRIEQVENFSCGSFHLGRKENGKTKRRQTNKCRVKVEIMIIMITIMSNF